MMEHLMPFEKIILKKFTDFSPVLQQVLTSQLANAKITHKSYLSYFQSHFEITGEVIKLETSCNVPMELVLDPCLTPEKKVIYCKKDSAIHLSCIGIESIGIQLDFRKGVLSVLEIYSPAGEIIDPENFPYNDCAEFYLVYDDCVQ